MADASKHFEAVGCGDEIPRSLGGDPSNGVVGIAPDIERRDTDRTERAADRAARAIPGQRAFHRVLVAEHGKMFFDRHGRDAVGGEPIAQPFGVGGENHIGCIRLKKGRVMPRAVRLTAIGLQGTVESIGMRPRQHGERCDPLRVSIGERPGDAAAPIMAGEMKAFVAVAQGRNDRHRVVHQAVDVIMRRVARVGPGAFRIAALTWRDGAMAHVGERAHLRTPAVHRFRKAVQQQHQRRAGLARDQRVEDEGGRN